MKVYGYQRDTTWKLKMDHLLSLVRLLLLVHLFILVSWIFRFPVVGVLWKWDIIYQLVLRTVSAGY